ncbi:MAG: TolC family protein, partial [Planctomycetota bacterium]|nr:TolC family protein [Planctomycetota bacterium]
PAGLPAELLRRRPDLRSLEERLRAADLRLYEARADLYPRLSLSGGAGRTSETADELSKGDFDIWSLAANLTQPIYQGGRLRAGVDLADARVAEALANLEQGLLIAFAEVETALAVDDHLAGRESSLRTASDHAAAARNIAEERYSSGLTALIAVLETQRRALNNESEWLAARRERLVARIDLHLALGGGFEGDEE